MDIKEDKHFQDFLKAKNYRKTSEVAAYQRLNKYCTYLNKTLTQIIEEAEEEEDQRF